MKGDVKYLHIEQSPELEQITNTFNVMREKYSKTLLCAAMLHFVIRFTDDKEFFLHMCNESWDFYDLSEGEQDQTVKMKRFMNDSKPKKETTEDPLLEKFEIMSDIVKACVEIFKKQNHENVLSSLLYLVCHSEVDKESMLKFVNESFDFYEGIADE